MEYSPPPFFKQGPSAFARLLFLALLAILLLVADARFNALVSIRKGVGTVLYPLQKLVLAPIDWADSVGAYFISIHRLERDNERLAGENTALAQEALVAGHLRAENDELRRLIATRERLHVKSLAAEILYDARDPSAHHIIIDRGTGDGLVAGLPAIDSTGVVGQVTRVFPFSAEVTLLTDRNQVISVQNLRSALRSVAYGGAENGGLELRFLATNADVQDGDTLVTSGLDGVFPAGLPVARISHVERNAAVAFARILCTPLGGTDKNRHLLILFPEKVDVPPPAVPAPVKREKKTAH